MTLAIKLIEHFYCTIVRVPSFSFGEWKIKISRELYVEGFEEITLIGL